MLHTPKRAPQRLLSAIATLTLLAAAVPIWVFAPAVVLGDATWVVTSLADDGGERTLRYAVDNSEDGDIIRFDSSLRGTITLDPALGQLILDHPLTIEGPGESRLAISGANETRVLLIKGPQPDCPYDESTPSGQDEGCSSGGGCESGDLSLPSREVASVEEADVVVSGLTIRDGFPKYLEPYPCIPLNPAKSPHGPGCYGGNVLCVRANAALIDCTIENGLAEQGGGVAARNHTSLLVQGCTIRDNVAGPCDSEVCGGSQYSGGGVDIRNHAIVELVDCDILNNTAADEGGGLAARSGGGSGESSSVTTIGCTISGNAVLPADETEPVSEEPGGSGECGDVPFYAGGGIYAKKISLLVEDCAIENNVVNDDEEMAAAGGGILMKRTAATIVGCTVANNTAGTGMCGGFAGGIASLNSDLQVRTCNIVDNAAGDGSDYAAGGGIYIGQGDFSTNYGAEPGIGGNLFLIEITDSLIAGNTAGSEDTILAAGGGVGMGQYEFVEPSLLGDFLDPASDEPESGLDDNLGTVLTNCTISGNTAINADDTSSGGGITNTGHKTLALNFCTVTQNESSFASGLSNLFPDAPEQQPCQPKLRLKNSIVAGNPCSDESFEIDGNWMSWSGNVISSSDTTAPEPGDCYDGGCGDIYITGDPLLGPLADNGGPTMTHALLPGCPAIDAACDCRAIGLVFNDPDEPADVQEVLLNADQRGSIRPVDGDGDGEDYADAGAYESQPDIAVPDGVGSANAVRATVGECMEIRVLVVNEGSATLVIDDIIVLNADAFSVVGDYSGTLIEGGDSIWVTLLFCPRFAGQATDTLRIISNDPDEAPLDVPIRGIGLREPADDQPEEPARMSTNYLLVDPPQVLPGQQVTISANVCNNGEEKGSQSVVLSVNGVAEQSQTVSASGGSCKAVSFTTARAVPGAYDVDINGQHGQFTVLAPRTIQASVPSSQDTGVGAAGIIAILVVMAALIAGLVVVFKR
jgi:hypothetical protein